MKRIIIKLVSALCAFALFAVPASAESGDTSYILPSGLSVEEFRSRLEAMESESAKTIDDDPFATAAQSGEPFASAEVGLFRGDEILYTGYFGFTDIDAGIKADENAVYEWGSISKTFVWVSAMQLWEQGRLDLDADIRAYLPDGFFRHLSYDEPITFMNLMNHNAGWQETVRPIETDSESAVLPLKEALQACEPAQIHRPGEVTAYSNYGAALAGYVIECVSGTDYCGYVHKNILEPLGMTHTSVNPTHSDNEWVREQRSRLRCYRADNMTKRMTDLGNALSFIMPYPAGAVTGTLGDMMKYGQALVNEGAPLFGSPETQKLLFTGTAFWGGSDIPSCCHGFWCDEYGVRTYGHGGATNAGQANLIFDLDSKVGLAVTVNEPDGNVFLAETPALAFGELVPEKYMSESAEKIKLDGYYTMSRSLFRGLFRFMPYLTELSLDEEAYDIGNGVYVLNDAMLLGSKTYPDGTRALEFGSSELVRDDTYILKLILITLYVIAAMAALYFIRVRHKLKKHKRYTAYGGAGIMHAGNIAALVSVAAWLGSFVLLSAGNGGLSFWAGAVIGITQMLCAAVCSCSAVGGIAALLSGKKNTYKHRYILNALTNMISVFTVVYFEMYMFWDI